MRLGWAGLKRACSGSRQLKGRKAALVLVAVEKRGQAMGRIRMAVITDFKSSTLTRLSETKRGPGSTVYTDGLKSFTGLREASVNTCLAPSLGREAAERHEVRRYR